MPVSTAASIFGVAIVPHTLKAFWAPIGDLTLNLKTWYLAALGGGIACLWVATTIPVTPRNVPVLAALVLCANLATTFLAFAVEG